jgi:multiple sugar transport system substrate-binding protein
MRFSYLTLHCAALWTFLLCSCYAKEVLTVGLVHDNVNERYLKLELEKEFERQAPHIDLQAVGVHTNQYKFKVIEWLKNGSGPDIFYWYGSERLKELARQEWVSPIDELWNSHSLDSAYHASVINQIKEGESYYGVPVASYPWSIFFNQALFKKFNLSPPSTWNELLDVCEQLQERDVIPIAIGYSSPWTLTAWFELLSLRLHGARFHNALLEGTVPYTDPRVKLVFERWKVLIDRGYFQENGEALDWDDPMTYLYREVAGMTLIGHFLSARIPKGLKDNIDLIPFPELVVGQERAELVPTDVFFIRASSQKQQYAKQFLAYITSPEAQIVLNQYTGGFSPLSGLPRANRYLEESGADILRYASATSPYFDRAVPTSFAEPAMQTFRAFMLNPDIERVAAELENLRLAKYGDK